MSHYFSENDENLKSNPQVIAFSVNNTPMKFNTNNGVFSKNNFDRGTNVLLKYLKFNDEHKSCLDLGCGYGVIGIYMNLVYNIDVDMVDVNKRAIELTKSNVVLNSANANVFYSDGFNGITKKYDIIITNPPIRAGKKVIYRFFEDSNKFLNENGEFYVVINKKHGADSAFNKLNTIYKVVEVVNKKNGFFVIRCENWLTIWRIYDIILNCQIRRFFVFLACFY